MGFYFFNSRFVVLPNGGCHKGNSTNKKNHKGLGTRSYKSQEGKQKVHIEVVIKEAEDTPLDIWQVDNKKAPYLDIEKTKGNYELDVTTVDRGYYDFTYTMQNTLANLWLTDGFLSGKPIRQYLNGTFSDVIGEVGFQPRYNVASIALPPRWAKNGDTVLISGVGFQRGKGAWDYSLTNDLGQTWIDTSDVSLPNNHHDVTYFNGYFFMAFEGTSGKIGVSNNGLSWTIAVFPSMRRFWRFQIVGSTLYAIGEANDSGLQIYRTTDGTTWAIERASQGSADYTGRALSNGITSCLFANGWIVVCCDTGEVLRHFNGGWVSWQTGITEPCWAIASSGTRTVAIGWNWSTFESDGTLPFVKYTPTDRPNDMLYWSNIQYVGNNQFIICGSKYMAVSINANEWTFMSTGATNNPRYNAIIPL